MPSEDGSTGNTRVRHEVALSEWEAVGRFPRSVSQTCPQSSRASLVTAGCEAAGNTQGVDEPSIHLRSGEDGKGERERILAEVSLFQHAGNGG